MKARPFILRFQESCVGPSNWEPRSGVETDTNVRAEAMTSEKERWKHENFTAGVQSGTQTATAVVSEGGDQDPQRPKHTAFDRVLYGGTRSITNVRAEASDGDERASAALAFPKGKLAISSGTQTHTRIQAEQADQDPGHREFEAIPSCSSS
jgi:hypothetical protein